MLDIKWIRQNPEGLDKALLRRGAKPCSEKILSIDTDRRSLMTQAQELQNQRNDASKKIGHAKAKGEDATALFEAVKTLGPKLKELEAQIRVLDEQQHSVLAGLPNLPAPDVPDGKDDTENQEIRRWGTPKKIAQPKPHYELGENLDLMNFERAAKIAGSRFVWLEGQLAQLERALTNYFLDTHTQKNGYLEASTPFMANKETLFGTGQLPKFKEDLFQTDAEYCMIPTSEVTLTNCVRGDIVPIGDLPIKLTAATPCFRREAGSAGRDTRGMIRLHQFTKVEMVQITHPEKAQQAFEEMVGHAEHLLQQLELPYRVVTLCTGDLGFAAHKTFDLEVWLPSQDAYREISSVSHCGTFQARRMKARYRQGDKQTDFVHTLNGSGLAVGRTMVALLENHQKADGRIAIPVVLQPYMGGKAFIEPKNQQSQEKAG